MSTDLTPRIRTKREFSDDGGSVSGHRVLAAHFAFGMRNLNSIAREFGVEKSNAKDTTILRGCDHVANPQTAEALKGCQFMVHCKGREFPDIFSLSDRTIRTAGQQVVSGLTETYYGEDQTGQADMAEAIRYKILLKSVLSYCKVITVDPEDNDLIILEVTTQKNGEGAIDAVFRGGTEDADVYLSLTEVTDFDFDAPVNNERTNDDIHDS